MKKLKLNKETISVLDLASKQQLNGGNVTGQAPCVNWTSVKLTECGGSCFATKQNRCDDGCPPISYKPM